MANTLNVKKLVLFIPLLLLAGSCVNKTETEARKSGQEIYFARTTVDYGEIKEGSDGRYIIEFKNIGDTPIVVNRVRASCGCTVPSWPEAPVEPGGTGEIAVEYNTRLTGSFMKSVYVYSSAENSPVKLTVKGKVLPLERPADQSKPE
jgi:hypothetical protein